MKLFISKYFSKCLLINFNHFQGFRLSYIRPGPFASEILELSSVENLVLIRGLFLGVPLPYDPHIFAAIRIYERNRYRPFALEPKRPNHVRAKCRQKQIIWQSYLTA